MAKDLILIGQLMAAQNGTTAFAVSIRMNCSGVIIDEFRGTVCDAKSEYHRMVIIVPRANCLERNESAAAGSDVG